MKKNEMQEKFIEIYSLLKAKNNGLDFPRFLMCCAESPDSAAYVGELCGKLVDKEIVNSYYHTIKPISLNNNSFSNTDNLFNSIRDAEATGKKLIMLDLFKVNSSYNKNDSLGSMFFKNFVMRLESYFSENMIKPESQKAVYILFGKKQMFKEIDRLFANLERYFIFGLNYYNKTKPEDFFIDLSFLRNEDQFNEDIVDTYIRSLKGDVSNKPGMVYPESIVIRGESKFVEGNKYQFTASVLPKEACQDIIWGSSNEKIMRNIRNGKFEALGYGKVQIIATSEDGKASETLEINVEEKVIFPDSMVIRPVNKFRVGDKVMLSAEVFPRRASQEVTWSVSDPKVAMVTEDGELIGLRQGIINVKAASKIITTLSTAIIVTVAANPSVKEPYEPSNVKTPVNTKTGTTGDDDKKGTNTGKSTGDGDKKGTTGDDDTKKPINVTVETGEEEDYSWTVENAIDEFNKTYPLQKEKKNTSVKKVLDKPYLTLKIKCDSGDTLPTIAKKLAPIGKYFNGSVVTLKFQTEGRKESLVANIQELEKYLLKHSNDFALVDLRAVMDVAYLNWAMVNDVKIYLEKHNTNFGIIVTSKWDSTFTALADYDYAKDKVSYSKNTYKLEEFLGKDESVETVNSTTPIDDEFNDFIGMKSAKKVAIQYIKNAIGTIKKEKMTGTAIKDKNLHLMFLGNPGCGKTTFARKLAHLYFKYGVVKEDKFTEISRTEIVGSHIGDTEEKIQSICENAKNGVIFIDEAYALCQSDSKNDFGYAAINALVPILENRNDLVFFFAGYDKEMKKFLETNKGIASRVYNTIRIEDYTSKELFFIFYNFIRMKKQVIDKDALELVAKLIKYISKNRGEMFSNGRIIRNIFQEIDAISVARNSDVSDDEVDFAYKKVDVINFVKRFPTLEDISLKEFVSEENL